MGLQNLPVQLLICILIRLPSKTLIKFLVVSKTWYSLITTSFFVSCHLHHNQIHDFHPPTHTLFIRRKSDSSPHCIWRYGEEFPPDWVELALPLPLNQRNSVEGTCNGLVCLVNTENHQWLRLWNPSIRRYINVDPVPIGVHSGERRVWGLGFDSLTNDYKVVAITYCCQYKILNGLSISPPYAKFYSINAGTWRDIGLPPFWRGDFMCITRARILNGVIHWVVMCKEIDVTLDRFWELGASILTFDVHNEDFGELKLPPALATRINRDLCLAVIDNLLAVLVGVIFPLEAHSYCVWQMKDYGVEESWMVLYSIQITNPFHWNPSLWDKEEGKVFITTTWGGLIVFNSKNQSSSVVYGEIASFDGKHPAQVFSFTESLALLDKRGQSQAEKVVIRKTS